MKSLTKIIAFVLFLLGTSAQAQVVLQDFSSVEDGGTLTFFYGTWEAAGNTVGSGSPNTQFIQGTGVYDITGTSAIIPTDGSTSQLEFFYFPTPANIGANMWLAVTAQALADNLASSFTVTLKDTGGYSAYAAFATSAFPTGSYTTQAQFLTPVGGFNAAAIDSLVISGNQLGGTATFNMSFDNIAAVTAVPEPTTFAAIAGVLALGFVAYRRRQTA